MKRVYFLLSLLAISYWMACEEPTEWDYQTNENGRLVVDAIITNQLKKQEIFLSLSYNNINGQAPPVSGAIIKMGNGQNEVFFSEDNLQAGRYVSNIAFATHLNKTYFLDIEYADQSYTATSDMIPVFPIPPPEFNVVNVQDSLLVLRSPTLFSNLEQAMYEIDIDWSHIDSVNHNYAKQFFYTLKTLDVSEVFRPDLQEPVFPVGSKVFITKYSLTDEFAAYTRALLLETEWQGGIYDESSASLPTNISNGGLGFFGVCSVLRDSVFAQ